MENLVNYKNYISKNNSNLRDFTKPRINENLNPYWVTGFIDGEGSFTIAILASTGSNKKTVSLRLSVTQKTHSVGILYDLQNFFGCGLVIPSSKDCMRFVVQRKEDIFKKIIPHFNKYSLITQKLADYLLFRDVVNMMVNKEHLTFRSLFFTFSLNFVGQP